MAQWLLATDGIIMNIEDFNRIQVVVEDGKVVVHAMNKSTFVHKVGKFEVPHANVDETAPDEAAKMMTRQIVEELETRTVVDVERAFRGVLLNLTIDSL